MTTTRGSAVNPPPWLWGGKPEEFFDAARLRLRPRGGTEGYVVQTYEDYFKRSHPLLVTTSVVLSAEGNRGPGFSQLSSFVDDDVDSSVAAILKTRGMTVPPPHWIAV